MAKIPECDIPRKSLPVIFVVDSSENMLNNVKIADINDGLRDVVEILKESSKKNADVDLKVGILQFGSECGWLTDGLQPVAEIEYKDLQAGGLPNFSAVLEELNHKLSRNEEGFLNFAYGCKMPVIIFITDGMFDDNCEQSLEQLWNNKWFAHGETIKIGIAPDKDANTETLYSVVGKREFVYQLDDNIALKKIMERSKVVSKWMCYTD